MLCKVWSLETWVNIVTIFQVPLRSQLCLPALPVPMTMRKERVTPSFWSKTAHCSVCPGRRRPKLASATSFLRCFSFSMVPDRGKGGGRPGMSQETLRSLEGKDLRVRRSSTWCSGQAENSKHTASPFLGDVWFLMLVKAGMFLCHAQAPWCYLASLFYPWSWLSPYYSRPFNWCDICGKIPVPEKLTNLEVLSLPQRGLHAFPDFPALLLRAQLERPSRGMLGC